MSSEADCAFLLCPDVPGLLLFGGGHPSYTILRSTDDGITWDTVLSGWPRVTSVLKQDPFDGSHIIAAALYNNYSLIYHSYDHGLTWTESPNTFSCGAIRDIHLSDEDSGRYLCSTAGGIYITDDGVNYTQVFYGSSFSFESDPERPGEIYASCGVSGVYMSTDDGYTWEPLPAFYRDDISVVAMEIVGGNWLYAGTNYMGAFRMQLESTGISESGCSVTTGGISVAATPVSGSVTLLVPPCDSSASILIYDVSGRVVASGTLPASAGSQSFAVENLLPGMYFAGLSTNGTSCRFVILDR